MRHGQIDTEHKMVCQKSAGCQNVYKLVHAARLCQSGTFHTKLFKLSGDTEQKTTQTLFLSHCDFALIEIDQLQKAMWHLLQHIAAQPMSFTIFPPDMNVQDSIHLLCSCSPRYHHSQFGQKLAWSGRQEAVYPAYTRSQKLDCKNWRCSQSI